MKNKSDFWATVKWIISLIVSIGIGTFLMNILIRSAVNVWLSRTIGVSVCAILGIILYRYFITKNN